jgi:hypothetical protein
LFEELMAGRVQPSPDETTNKILFQGIMNWSLGIMLN